jgi:hypothetical protein
MSVSAYRIVDRYELTCPACQGMGCVNCRQGLVPVYVLVAPGGTTWCRVRGHHVFGHAERAEDAHQLPHVAWCQRCDWQQIHTDVPEAYDLVVEHIA